MDTLNDLLEHQKAFNRRLYLVPSENSPSINARLAFLTDVIGRYYFPLDRNNNSAFPGNEFTGKIYERCRKLLREATGANFVNLRPISGLNAMTVALASLVSWGETVAIISPENGGHNLTSFIARRLGIRTVFLPYLQEEFSVDIAALPDFVKKENVSLIYLDQMHILFPQKLKEMRSCLPAHIKIYYDGSHVLGLIFGRQFQNPLEEGAAFLGGSTHKTIPGPHKAFISTNDQESYERINKMSQILISHDHGADVAALTIVLEEMEGKWQSYASQVIKNAQHLGQALKNKGFTLVAEHLGFTKCHQLFIDIAPYQDAFDAAMALARVNVIVNSYKVVPAIRGRAVLRLGVQELTYLGAKENVMDEIADIFEEIFIRKKYSEEDIRRRVAELKSRLLPPMDRGLLEKIIESLRN